MTSRFNIVEQGETFGFETGLSGTATESFTTILSVMQYPGDTPAISRTITNGVDTLTSTETASLAVGQWTLHLKSIDSDEDIREPIKIYISKGWL